MTGYLEFILTDDAVNGAQGPNGLPQLANPQPNFDATTNTGQFGPFVPVSAALPAATGAPQTVDAQTAQALQAAADNWAFDTSQVSNFLNTGKSLTGNQFNQGANIAYNAEVDELTHKAILDQVIGNDPDAMAPAVREHRLLVRARHHPAGRVVRRVDHQQARLRRQRGQGAF